MSQDNDLSRRKLMQNIAAASTVYSLTGYQIRNAPKWTLQGGVDFDEEKPLRDNPALATFCQTCILDRMLKEKQHSRASSKIALVDEDCTTTQQVAMPL